MIPASPRPAASGRLHHPGALSLLRGLWLLAGLAALVGTAPHAAAQIAPGDDLARRVLDAEDGATLRLAAGRFDATIVVRGKDVILRGAGRGETTLATTRANAAVIVEDGGTATLRGLSIDADRPEQVAGYARGGTLVLERVTVDNGGLYVEGGTLRAAEVRLAAPHQNGVTALDRAEIALSNLRIPDAPDRGIVAQNAASVRLTRSHVTAANEAVWIRGAQAAEIGANTLLSHSSERATLLLGDAGSGAPDIHDNIMGGGRQSLDVRGLAGPARIADNTLFGGASGGAALGGDAAATPHVTGNAVIVAGDARSWGLYFSGAVSAQVTDNIVLSDGAGLVLRENAAAELEGNTVVAGSVALAFDGAPATATRVTDDILWPVPSSESGPKLGPRMAGLIRALEDGAGPRLEDAAAHVLVATVDARSLPPGDLPDRLAGLEAAVDDLRAAAGTMAQLTVRARGRGGDTGPVAFTVYNEAGEPVIEQATGAGPAVLEPARYTVEAEALAALRTVELESGASRAVTLDARRAVWTGDPGDRTLLRFRSRPEMTRMLETIYRPDTVRDLPRPGVEPEARLEALRIAREWRDRRGPALAPDPDDPEAGASARRNWNRVNRIAEGILRALGTARDVPAAADDIDMAAYMEARLGRLRDGRVAAAAAGATGARAAAALGRYGVQGHETRLLEALRGALDRGDYDPFLHDAVEHLRHFPSPEVRAAFRAVADAGNAAGACRMKARALHEREGEARSIPDIVDDLGCGPRGYWRMAHAVVPYLAAHGEAQDWQRIAAADRLLITEELAPYLATPELLLDREMRSLAGPRRLATPTLIKICESLRAVPPGERAALYERMRDTYEQALRDKTGWDRLSTHVLYDVQVAACRPSSLAAGWYIRHLGHQAPELLGSRWGVIGTNWEIEPRDLYTPRTLLTKRLDWFVEPALAPRMLEELFERSEGDWYFVEEVLAQLDAVPHDRVTDLLAPYRGESALRDALIELMTAYHRAMTRQPVARATGPADGTQRRPYLLRQRQDENYGGALSGILEMRPSLAGDGKTLRIGLRVDQEVHLFRNASGLAVTIAGMDKPEAYDVHEYVLEGGRKLIGSVGVMDDSGSVTPLTRTGVDENGFHVFEGEVDGAGFDGRFAVVDLGFGREPQFVFDLFSKDAARQWRQARTALDIAVGLGPVAGGAPVNLGATRWPAAAEVYAGVQEEDAPLADRIARAQRYIGAGLPDGDAASFATLRSQSRPALRAGIAGQVLFAKRHFARAAWMFAEQARQAPDGTKAEAAALNNLGAMLAEVHADAPDRHPDTLLHTALAATRRAAELAPEDGAIRNTRGKVAARTAAALREAEGATSEDRAAAERLTEEAVAAAERAVELAPDVPLHWTNLARARRSAGDGAGAGAALREAHRRRPNGPAFLSTGHPMLSDAAVRRGFEEAPADYCAVDFECLEVCPGSIVGRLKVISCEYANQDAVEACKAGKPYPKEYDCLAEIPSYGIIIPGLNAGASFVTPWGTAVHFTVDGRGRVRFSGTLGVAKGSIGAYGKIEGIYDPEDGVSVSNVGAGISITATGSTPVGQQAGQYGFAPGQIDMGAETGGDKPGRPTVSAKSLGVSAVSI